MRFHRGGGAAKCLLIASDGDGWGRAPTATNQKVSHSNQPGRPEHPRRSPGFLVRGPPTARVGRVLSVFSRGPFPVRSSDARRERLLRRQTLVKRDDATRRVRLATRAGGLPPEYGKDQFPLQTRDDPPPSGRRYGQPLTLLLHTTQRHPNLRSPVDRVEPDRSQDAREHVPAVRRGLPTPSAERTAPDHGGEHAGSAPVTKL